jgi:hypothetical protein
MSFDGLFRKDRPNTTLQWTALKLIVDPQNTDIVLSHLTDPCSRDIAEKHIKMAARLNGAEGFGLRG